MSEDTKKSYEHFESAEGWAVREVGARLPLLGVYDTEQAAERMARRLTLDVSISKDGRRTLEHLCLTGTYTGTEKYGKRLADKGLIRWSEKQEKYVPTKWAFEWLGLLHLTRQ